MLHMKMDIEALRTQNKTLINILKARQTLLKETSKIKTDKQPYDALDSSLEIINVSKPIQSSSSARQKLTQGKAALSTQNVHQSNGLNPERFKTTKSKDKSFDLNELEQELESIHSKATVDSNARLSDASSKALTSTPVHLTPDNSILETTPKSILKHRKIIEDNIKVESKYPHTPTHEKHDYRGLNYSYSDYDDLKIAQARLNNKEKDTSHQPEYNEATNGSLTEEQSLSFNKENEPPEKRKYQDHENELFQNEKLDKNEENQDRIREREHRDRIDEEVKSMLRERLMKDSGNDRQNATLVRELTERPKAVVFDLEAPQMPTNLQEHPDTNCSQGTITNLSLRNTMAKSGQWDKTKGQPLLGYDWIVGMMENESSLLTQPDDYFQQIQEFRRVNRDACQSTRFLDFRPFVNVNRSGALVFDPDRPISPPVANPTHTCIHGYQVNDRLFTEPMKIGEDGKSMCPVCLQDRQEPTIENPGFVRVSIPRSTLAPPYKIVPHRRKSFDSTDSYSLSSHCLAGWHCAKPSSLPTASTLDLNDRVKDKETTARFDCNSSWTYDKAKEMADSYSKMERLMNTSCLPPTKLTKDLLNTSSAFRFDIQRLEKCRGLGDMLPANSTAYPAM